MYRFTHAIVRRPGADCHRGLTTSTRGAADPQRLVRQHQRYARTLLSLGLEVQQLPPLKGFPDAYFVEDTAVILRDGAVITRPGARQRKGETGDMARVLSQYRRLFYIEAPGCIDGGDVLQADNHFFIGLSQRTNEEGARQLGRLLESSGHTWETVPVANGLHLKSGVNYLNRHLLMMTPAWTAHKAFGDYERIVLDPREAYAANSLRINDHILMPAGFPGAKKKLRATGLTIIELAVDEIRKMDGGLTCMSLRFNSFARLDG